MLFLGSISKFAGPMCISLLALNSRSCQHPHNLEMYRSFPFKLEICVVFFCFSTGKSQCMGTFKCGK